MDVTQFKGNTTWAQSPLSKISTKVKTALTRKVNAARISCSALPLKEEVVKRVAKTEESPEEAYNPESSVIQEIVKEEVKEEEEEGVDIADMTENMTKSGYQLKLAAAKSSRRPSSKANKTGQTSKGISRGRVSGPRSTKAKKS